MSDHKTDVANAKAKTIAAMISLLAAMKRYDFAMKGDADSVSDAFDKLCLALHLLNESAP